MKPPPDAWTIKSKCLADWEKMKGDDKRRFCDQCQRFVYNVSAMDQRERDTFAQRAKMGECVYYRQGADGRIADLFFLTKLRRWFPLLRWLRWSALVALVPAAFTGCIMMGKRCAQVMPSTSSPPQTESVPNSPARNPQQADTSK
jgi:hypothetical protein